MRAPDCRNREWLFFFDRQEGFGGAVVVALSRVAQQKDV
jgi:hypothetical protein